jgi:hypothetical protein
MFRPPETTPFLIDKLACSSSSGDESIARQPMMKKENPDESKG